MTRLSLRGREVVTYVVRPELALALSPRPYLHPVRTLAGVRVTDAVPYDHPWHLGVGVGVQHVCGPDGQTVNFWGGRTYLPEAGYTWLDDHGRVEHVRWLDPDPALASPSALGQELRWRVPGAPPVLRERRTVAAIPLRDKHFHDRGIDSWKFESGRGDSGRGDSGRGASEGLDSGWVLRFSFILQNVTAGPVTLGSPGTHGRVGAGYGGFFWRAAPSATPIRVATSRAEGEDAVHGHPAEWLSFSGTEVGTGRGWSLLLAGVDETTRADPWFVRTRDYPGVGSALAFDRPVVLDPGASISRSLLVTVLDGDLDPAHAAAVLAAARRR